MIESVINEDLSPAWEVGNPATFNEDGFDLARSTVEPVATHEDDIELYIQRFDDEWLVNITQVVEFDGTTVDVATDGTVFDDEQTLAQYVLDACGEIDSGDGLIDAFAIVPHAGDLESVTTGGVGINGQTGLPEFADVFCVYTQQLPKRVSYDDIATEGQDIVDLIYGKTEDVPETMQVLNSSTEAVGHATIEVFTVTGEDIDLDD